jgi:hypothetical protein
MFTYRYRFFGKENIGYRPKCHIGASLIVLQVDMMDMLIHNYEQVHNKIQSFAISENRECI